MIKLSSNQRRFLRARANRLRAMVMVGKAGLTDQVLAQVDHALENHELIKVKLLPVGDDPRLLADEVANATGSTLVMQIGGVAVLYRQHPDREQRKVLLPRE